MFGRVYLYSQIKTEDDQADDLKALSEAAWRLPGRRAMPGVRGDGQGGRTLHKRQQQQHGDGQAQTPAQVDMWWRSG